MKTTVSKMALKTMEENLLCFLYKSEGSLELKLFYHKKWQDRNPIYSGSTVYYQKYC